MISRMLVTDPKQRATMQEVMNHPWMVKGYGGPPENYLPPREPLTLPLEPGVIHAMTGFGFGTPEDIQHRLTRIVESRRYKQAIENYEKDRGAPLIPPKDVEKRSGFGGLFSKGRNTVASRETLNASMEGLKLGEDPLNAFHPMVSIYYLVKEKQERDQKEQKERGEQQHTTPKLQPPTSRQEPLKQPSPVARPKEKHSMAEITPPQPVHTEPRARQRARSHSEDQARDQVDDGLLQIPARQEGSFAGMLRRLSTRGPRRPKDLLDPKSASNPMPQRGAMSMRASKSLGHARRESIQARRAKREAEKKQEAKELPTTAQPVKEETDAEILGNSHGNVDGADDASAGGMSNDDRLEHADSSSADLAKPVFLRGIFSVSTTSTRPLPEIRADIKRVLKQLDVDYTEIKGGFSCTHAPSVVDEPDSLEPTVPGGEIQFEILVVKVPIVSLHGVQFKRVGGNTWQYKNMAEQVVKELRL